MYGNKVFIATNDVRMIALNRDSGEVVWEMQAARADRSGDRHALAQDPGLHGGPAGDQDRAAARSWCCRAKAPAASSARAAGSAPGTSTPASWRGAPSPSRRRASPAARPGRTTTMPGGPAAAACGRPAPTIRPPTCSTTAPATRSRRFDPEFRPGDNLFTASTIALDADTGKIVWYFQDTPNEHWDFDTPSPKMLYDVKVNGETRKVVANFSRNGFFYTLDRANGQFLRADQYQEKVTWTKGIDPKTGKPVDYDPSRGVQLYAGIGAHARQARPGGLPLVERLADLLPAHPRSKRMIAYVAGAEGCIVRHRRQDPARREQGLCRAAAVLPPSRAACTRPRRAVGASTCDRKGRRQGDVPAADRVRHAEHRWRSAVHRPS